MYEVLDIPRMMKVKSPVVRGRKHIPKGSSDPKLRYGAVFLVRAGMSLDLLNDLPDGTVIKVCLQDRSLWEVFVPGEFKKSKKLFAKRLDAVAFM